MQPTPKLNIRVLGRNELSSYIPDNSFWALWELWHGGLSASALHVEKKQSNLVVIRVDFLNESNTPMELDFNNIGCKAELLNLVIKDTSGKAIRPIRGVHIRPNRSSNQTLILSRGDKYTFDLVGEVFNNNLIFPGARYALPENRVIQIMFTFDGARSNIELLAL
jgi:hypothetical protein